jgi:protein YibB
MNDISIVTGFFDIDRSTWLGEFKRDSSIYLSYFDNMARIENEIIIFCEEKYSDNIYNSRKKYNNHNNTKIEIENNIFQKYNNKLLAIEKVMKNSLFLKYLAREDHATLPPEQTSPQYNLITSLKPQFAVDAINKNLVSNNQLAWIDFGYCRELSTLPKNNRWKYNFGNKITIVDFDLLDYKYLDTIFNICKTGNVYFPCGQIIAPLDKWNLLNEMFKTFSDILLECDLCDDDQTLLFMSFRKNPELFNTIRGLGWFDIFKINEEE